MSTAAVDVRTFFSENPCAGMAAMTPRADAEDPSFFRVKGGARDPHPGFFRLAKTFRALRGWREDASLTAAFARSMEHIIAKLYAVEFAEYRAHEFFPSSTEVDPGAMSFTYRMLQRTGNAQVINAGNARDLPRISVGGQEFPSPVITYGAAYGFNIIEEKSAALANIALDSELAKATREAIEAFADKMYCIGIPNTDIVGVTNAPGVQIIPQVSIAAGTWAKQIASIGTASTTNATPPAVVVAQAIATDLMAAKSNIKINTAGRHKATNVLLPTNLYEMLDTTPRSPGFTDDTLLEYLEQITGLEFDDWYILQNIGNLSGSPATIAQQLVINGGGATSTQQKTRIVVYEKNPDVVQLMEAQPFIQLAPQLAGLEYTVPCFERSGGVMSVRPLAITCIDGCAQNVTGQDVDAFYAGHEAGVIGSTSSAAELDGLTALAY